MAKRRQSNNNFVRSRCTVLLVVDQKPFLQKALSACRRLRTELHKKQENLREFEESDVVAFNQWVSSTFGKELTRIRELREELSQYEYLWNIIRYCDIFSPEKLPEVIPELMERKKKGTLHAFVPPWEKKEKASAGDGDGGKKKSFHEDEDEDYDDHWEGEGEDDDDYEDDGWEAESEEEKGRFFGEGSFRDWMRSEGKEKNRSDDARIKSLYRSLVKMLHPDHSDMEKSIREKRWYELQEAYARGDLEAMRRIETVCDMDQTGLSIKLGLARLWELIHYHQAHLAPIRKALRFAKKEKAFGFTRYGPTKAVHDEITMDLKETLYELKEQISRFEEQMDLMSEDIMNDALYSQEDDSEENYEEQEDSGEKDDVWGSPTKHHSSSHKKKKPAYDSRQMDLF